MGLELRPHRSQPGQLLSRKLCRGAKQDFAIRAGLISKQQIFNQEQLVEIYRCCSDTLDAGFDLTAEQEKCIRGIQEQIAIAAPDALDRIREQEQHLMEPYNQEPIM